MINLFGNKLTKKELFERIGNLSQIAGVRKSVLKDGKEDGVEMIEVRTGAGLNYKILPGRCLDIAWADFEGVPVSFISKSGVACANYWEPTREPWGDMFYGGLMTTCGLTCVGAPNIYNGRRLPQHGEIATIPATNVGTFEDWDGDSMKMGARGVVRQSYFNHENLELTREISSKLGENTIIIKDTVENIGCEKQPLMILYHFNFGYPFVSPDAETIVNSAKTVPTCDADPKAVDLYSKFFEPGQDPVGDRCVHHTVIPDGDGISRGVLQNKKLGIKATVEFKNEQLKALCNWTRLLKGDYVTALEPTNNFGKGTGPEEQNGTLEYIEPGEKRQFEVRLVFERL